jgi:ParB-like chromosome segregation protein Spo0J
VKLETWPIERFRAYKNNPRKNDRVVGKMVEAIREFGFRIPIIARSDGEVVDGHLRLKAALELGMREAPALLADDLSEAQIKAFRLLVNKSVGWAEWDNDLLIMELNELRGMDYDIKKTGFGEK